MKKIGTRTVVWVLALMALCFVLPMGALALDGDDQQATESTQTTQEQTESSSASVESSSAAAEEAESTESGSATSEGAKSGGIVSSLLGSLNDNPTVAGLLGGPGGGHGGKQDPKPQEKTKLTVYITGDSETYTYDGKAKKVQGYTLSYEWDSGKDPDYSEDDFKFTGSDVVTGTNAGTYPMGLKASQFENNNKKYEVEFVVEDGYLKINPVTDKVTVTITESSGTVTYSGNEYLVSGYDHTDGIKSDNPLYDVTTSVKETPTAAWQVIAKDAGTYPLGILPSDFKNVNPNFTNVEFKIIDGFVVIKPVTEKVTVYITGNSATYTYDGTEKTVSYKARANNSLYNTDSIITKSGTSSLSGTNVTNQKMQIYAQQFSNGDKNFTNVVFKLADKGNPYLTLQILPRPVTFTGESNTVTYNRQEQSITGISADNLVEGHSWSGLTYCAKGTNADSYAGSFTGNLIIISGTVNVTDNYEVTLTPGALTICPVTAKVTVTIKGNSATHDYDGKEHSVEGYTAESSNPLFTESDWYFDGEALASGTEVGTYAMGLSADQFSVSSKNFADVTFDVTDGELEIVAADDDDADDDDADKDGSSKKHAEKDDDSAEDEASDGTPKTGDATNALLPAALMAGAAAAAMAARTRRREN